MIDWLPGLMTPEQWEALRNWLATIGGVAALLIAALTYRRNVKLKREEQARLVYATLGSWRLVSEGDSVHNMPGDTTVTWSGIDGQFVATEPLIQAQIAIHNRSKELIGPIRLRMVDRELKSFFVHGPRVFEARIAEVEPESKAIANITFPNPKPITPWIGTDIQFRDASGQWWGRHLSEPIRALRARKVEFEYR